MNNVEVLLQQDDVRGCLRYVGCAIHRDTYIRSMERGRVVDTVAQETARLDELFEGKNDAQLLLRGDAGKESRFGKLAKQGLGTENGQFRAINNLTRIEAKLGA